MKDTARRGLRLALTLVCAACAGLLLWQLYQYWAAERLNDRADALSGGSAPPSAAVATPPPSTAPPEPTPTPIPMPEPDPDADELLARDLAALDEVNPEVVGWIWIPDTEVAYPLVQAADNEKYLDLAWDGTKNRAGSIFLERRSSPELSDFNTIVYGHHMKNGSMFAALMKYREQAFYEEHPVVWVVNGDGAYRWRVFASYEAPVTSNTYRLVFEDNARRQEALDYYLDSSVIDTGIVPTVEDRVLTLSTCTGTGRYETRWVVQAALDEFYPRGYRG